MHWFALVYLCLFAALIVSGLWHDMKTREDFRFSATVALAELIVLGLASGKDVARTIPLWLGAALLVVAALLTVADFRREVKELRRDPDYDPRLLALLNLVLPLLLLPAYWMATTNVFSIK